MPSSRTALVVAVAVAFALATVTVQALLVLWHQPVQQGAWRVGAVAVVLAGVWWLVNTPVEGPTLLSLSYDHGFTLADVGSLPALLAGAAVLAQVVRAS